MLALTRCAPKVCPRGFPRRFLSHNISKRRFVQIFDVAIVGAGSAGVSAAIHARFDGLKTLLLEERAIGGGAFFGTPNINNVAGYPLGVSGASLSLSGIQQFEKLGGSFLSRKSIKKIHKSDSVFFLIDQNEMHQHAKKIILATGVAYRTLNLPFVKELTGKGIYYEVEDSISAELHEGSLPIFIYGGGNSAGQAAAFYRSFGASVTVLYRGNSLDESMSKHLIDKITRTGCKLMPNTVIEAVNGDMHLRSIKVRDLISGEGNEFATQSLFVMIGGMPPSLPLAAPTPLALDNRGYIQVDAKLQTNIKGIYAAGDITSVGAGRIQLAQAQGVQATMQVIQSLNENA